MMVWRDAEHVREPYHHRLYVLSGNACDGGRRVVGWSQRVELELTPAAYDVGSHRANTLSAASHFLREGVRHLQARATL